MIDTSNTVSKVVAKKLEISEDIIKSVYDYYWKNGVKKAIRSGKYTSVRVSKLGTFMVSRRKLYRHIQKYIAYIRHLRLQDTISFKRSTKEEAISKYIDDLKLLLERRNDLAILYNKLKENNKNVKLYKTSLGKQTSNIGGNLESLIL